MRFLLDADDDWIEGFMVAVYPSLHPILKPFGGYAVGTVGYNQYVGTFEEDEEVIEEELVAAGALRNPVACLKSLRDGRVEEGNWRVTFRNDPLGKIEPGFQLHIHLFERADGLPGRELYAHYEDDWAVSPIAHLREKNFSVEKGVELAQELIDEHTFLTPLKL